MLFIKLALFGNLFLFSSLIFSIIQLFLPFLRTNKDYLFLKVFKHSTSLTFLFSFLSFFVLVISFLISDFSIKLVYEHSHTLKPLIYKLTGTWGNHEGSLLLWITILHFFGFLISLSKKIPDNFKFKILSIHGFLSITFLSLSIFTSNPFETLSNVPLEGRGLNPILQDLGLAIHPPLLYMGYVGLSVSYLFAFAALINKKIEDNWANLVRPWIIMSWVFLTVGISLGSFWAYYELGWGGWWYWDPVENVAIMPWLIATALIHSIIVTEYRQLLFSWSILLSILGFSLSLLGTFIVRSGVLTSVHSFASDPKRGLFILIILSVFTIIPLIIFGFRSKSFSKSSSINILSKEGFLILNNLLLCITTVVILVGTLYPLFLEFLSNVQITVGPPFFIISLKYILLVMMLLMGIGPILLWGNNKFSKIFEKLKVSIITTFVFLIVFLILYTSIPIEAILGYTLAFWIIITSFSSLYFKIKTSKVISKINFLQFLPITIAHIGIAIFAFGVISDSYFSKEKIIRLNIDDHVIIDKNKIIFEKARQEFGQNFISLVAYLKLIDKNNNIKYILKPEKRFYPVENQTTSEVSIYRSFAGDIYTVLSDVDSSNGFIFRIYEKPFVSFIWIGAIFMTLGGIISLFFKIFNKVK